MCTIVPYSLAEILQTRIWAHIRGRYIGHPRQTTSLCDPLKTCKAEEILKRLGLRARIQIFLGRNKWTDFCLNKTLYWF
jgi:hypothetical protein